MYLINRIVKGTLSRVLRVFLFGFPRLSGRAEMMLREHIALFKEAQNRRDAGFFKTTPFFISFVEPAKKLRAASCAWQMAVANWALGQPDKAKQLTQQALDGEPFTLYAYLLADELKKQ